MAQTAQRAMMSDQQVLGALRACGALSVPRLCEFGATEQQLQRLADEGRIYDPYKGRRDQGRCWALQSSRS